MNDSSEKRMRDYLDGTISGDELEKLNLLLEKDEEARAQFRKLATLDEGLRDLAESSQNSSIHSFNPDSTVESNHGNLQSPPNVSLFKRPFFAAAAGLVIGVFFTTAIWAATESGRQKIQTLVHDSFEFGAPPLNTGMPTESDIWSGDYTRVVSDKEGITPVHGDKMLQFLRADYEGKTKKEGYISDIYRVIDLRSRSPLLATGDAVVSVEAAFRSIPFQKTDQYHGGIWINAMNEIPSRIEEWESLLAVQGKLNKESLASSLRWFKLPESGEFWQESRSELLVPPETKYLIISIQVIDRSAIPPTGAPPAVEFPGHFLDDVRISIRRQHSSF